MEKNKLRFQGFIIGVLISSILMFSITGFASEISKSIKVVFNSVIVKIDGKTLPGDNINYNNNIYIRADKVSEIFNKKFAWDKKKNDISIGNVNQPTPTPTHLSYHIRN